VSGVLTGKLRLETARRDHKSARTRCGYVGESVEVAAYAQPGGSIEGKPTGVAGFWLSAGREVPLW
jgi:hypothetical protein